MGKLNSYSPEELRESKAAYDKRKEEESVLAPAHYHSGGVDVIKFSELQFSSDELKGFHRINVIKYITRYDKKGTPLQDLQKAKVYLDKLIELEESK
ncbi:DUF3310 domain-containing protein [Planococcus sp. A6]|uniref:DUF3310 domain-containing protein n=1 Tax=Planococcus sp. A6 TaxID=2992760 RepID=UPI00237BB251|nr:DUF3310 domain-containing protein [Planococcus sp. A6]MDE0582218.1 DUF3310 domain-containing protein [Planococcus sp. A6]